MIDNPFKELMPEEEPPIDHVEAQVMGSIHLKSYLADIAEFFMAIFGITITESLNQPQAPDPQIVPKLAKPAKKKQNPNKPDYFF
jgi:hypothetical protein